MKTSVNLYWFAGLVILLIVIGKFVIIPPLESDANKPTSKMLSDEYATIAIMSGDVADGDLNIVDRSSMMTADRHFRSVNPIDSVFQFYVKNLPKNGWKLSMLNMQKADGALAMFCKSNVGLTIQEIPSKNEMHYYVGLTWTSNTMMPGYCGADGSHSQSR